MKVNIGTYPTHRFYHVWLYSWFGYSPSQSIKVKIDKWDTWSMDCTLAHIILPMLVQLKATEAKWNDIMDKMIYAFEHKVLDGEMIDTGDQKKMQEGFRLFGKYFQHLWD
jgi:hypothetical protein